MIAEIETLALYRTIDGAASMRPRSYDRGNPTLSRVITALSPSRFNEAAIL